MHKDKKVTFPSNTAIILLNTGSPRKLSKRSVYSYLVRFLTDERIIGIPYIFRHLLVRGLIAPLRAPFSLQRYRKAWTDEGPVLHVYSNLLARRMEETSGCRVITAMRYERESYKRALETLHNEGIERIVALPLFPHYAKSSFETAYLYLEELHCRGGYSTELLTVSPFFDHPLYLDAVAAEIARTTPKGSHIIFSYHGIPLYQVEPYKGDTSKDYPAQCYAMREHIMGRPEIAELSLTSEVAFQSRFGHHEWLSPATANRLNELPGEGHKHVTVVCPSFVCDCLETVEEIGHEGRTIFTKAGGDTFTLVPCANHSDATVNALLQIAYERLTK